MTSDRSCYSNKSFFPQIGSPREVKEESVRASFIEIFWDQDFIVKKLIR